jgi:hypothetical protein
MRLRCSGVMGASRGGVDVMVLRGVASGAQIQMGGGASCGIWVTLAGFSLAGVRRSFAATVLVRRRGVPCLATIKKLRPSVGVSVRPLIEGTLTALYRHNICRMVLL